LPARVIIKSLFVSILANLLLASSPSTSLSSVTLESCFFSTCFQLQTFNLHSLTHPDDARHSLHLLNSTNNLFLRLASCQSNSIRFCETLVIVETVTIYNSNRPVIATLPERNALFDVNRDTPHQDFPLHSER
jgi:hypothetical protein